MKKICVLLFFIFLFILTCAQDSPGRVSPDLFSGFKPGITLFKSGDTVCLKMNYNTFLEKMLFENEKQYFEIDNLESIDTVYILDRKFIPVKRVFYEVISLTPSNLYIQHRCKLDPLPKPAGFGTVSETTAISRTSNILSASSVFVLDRPETMKTSDNTLLWLRNGKKYYKANNEKQIIKYFPQKTDLIRQFVKDNKTDFEKTDDVKKLIIFCNR